MKAVKTRTLIAALPLLTAALLMVVACSDFEPDKDGRIGLNVTSGIQSRAHDTSWDVDDAIGIYMFKSDADIEGANYKYVTANGGENGVFTPAAVNQILFFPFNGDTRDFMAYYPYTTLAADNIYNVDVAHQSSQAAIDLMASNKVTGKSKDDASVAFVFEHKLVKLDLTFKSDGISIADAELAGAKVAITNQQTKATYKVVDGGNVAVTSASAEEISLLVTDLKAEGIILPTSDTEGMKLTFTIPNLNNQVFEWVIKSAQDSQRFDAGKRYKYTITIAKQGITVSSTVTDWLPGNGEDGESGDAE